MAEEETNDSTLDLDRDKMDRSTDLLASQVGDSLSGMSLGAIRCLEQAVERAAAALDEEGEDSVFYDDGEAPVHGASGRPLFFGAKERSAEPQRLFKAKTAGVSVENGFNGSETDPRADGEDTRIIGLLYKSNNGSLLLTNHETAQPLTETVTQGSNQTPVGLQAHSGQKKLADKASAVHEMDVKHVPDTTAQPVDEDSGSQLEGKPETSSSSEDELSSGSQEEVEEEGTSKRSQDFLACQGNVSSGEAKSGLPRCKKSSNCNSSSKINTVSYRKIRKGNTRQKIVEFESMMMKQ
ncbi:hypothetical protein UPYG_G00313370 [Umbra pygmaea]|uniref:Ermin n=1 Tax=Umbra pygmaea TaxID=75934 RepID=A0ABD0WJ95_UMBPY